MEGENPIYHGINRDVSGVIVRASDVEVCRPWGSTDGLENFHEWDAIPDTGSFATRSTLKRDAESLLSRGGTLQTGRLRGESEAELATHVDPIHHATGEATTLRFRMLTQLSASPETRTLHAGLRADGMTATVSLHNPD